MNRCTRFLALLILLLTALPTAAAPAVTARTPPEYAAPPPELTLINHGGGRLDGIEIQGDYAYGWVGPSLLIFAVADSAQPILVGRLLQQADIVDVAVSGEYAYLALGRAGSAIVRISDPTAPALAGSLPTTTYAGIAAQAGRIYAAVPDKLLIYDLANPTAPALLGSVAIYSIHGDLARQLAVSGAYAYVPMAWSYVPMAPVRAAYPTLAIINISNPTVPVAVGYIDQYFEYLAVSGRYVYLNSAHCVTNRCGPGDAQYTTLLVFDAANPAAPVRISETTWPRDRPESSLAASSGIGFLSGDLLDLRNPAAPKRLGHPNGGDETIKISGQRGFARGRGVQIIDLVNPLQPTVAGRIALSSAYGTISVHGQYVLTVFGGFQATVTDLAAQPYPRVVGSVDLPFVYGVRNMANTGAVSYLATTDGLITIDWRVPTAPTASKSGGSLDAVQVDGDRLYASDGILLWVYDLSDPGAPSPLFTRRFADALVQFVKRDDLLYSTSRQGRLTISDLSGPGLPTAIYTATLPFLDTASMLLSGDYLLLQSAAVSDGQSSVARMQVLDVSNPRRPVTVLDQYAYGHPAWLAADESFAYRFNGVSLEVWDTTARPTPAVISSRSSRFPMSSAGLDGQRLVVAAQVGGFYEFATPTARVSGTITDGYRTPLAGVTLAVAGQTVANGADGAFVFDGLPSGWATVTPRRNGLRFIPASRTVRAGWAAPPISFIALPVPVSVTVGTGATALVSLDLRDRPTLVDLPAGTVPAGTTVTFSPTLVPAGGPELIAGHVFDLALSGGAAFAAPVTVTVGYSAADLRAISDPAALRVARWAAGTWIDASADCATGPQRQDPAAGWVRATVCQPGRYALLGPTNLVVLPYINP